VLRQHHPYLAIDPATAVSIIVILISSTSSRASETLTVTVVYEVAIRENIKIVVKTIANRL